MTSVCAPQPFLLEFEQVQPRSKFCQEKRENVLSALLLVYDWVVVVMILIVAVVTGTGIGTGKGIGLLSFGYVSFFASSASSHFK